MSARLLPFVTKFADSSDTFSLITSTRFFLSTISELLCITFMFTFSFVCIKTSASSNLHVSSIRVFKSDEAKFCVDCVDFKETYRK